MVRSVTDIRLRRRSSRFSNPAGSMARLIVSSASALAHCWRSHPSSPDRHVPGDGPTERERLQTIVERVVHALHLSSFLSLVKRRVEIPVAHVPESPDLERPSRAVRAMNYLPPASAAP
jgi:hypothetical protein